MSKYGQLNTDIDQADDDPSSEPRTRRLSLQVTDLPVTQYFTERWNCCGCCKKSQGYAQMDDELLDEDKSLTTGKSMSRSRSSSKSPRKSKRDKQAQEKLMAEQCLDATVNKIVNNLSWVNATLLAVAMKNTLEVDFSHVGSDYAAANNAWIYFFVIFIIGIIIAVGFRVFEDINEMKRELELKTEEKYVAYIIYPCTNSSD